MINSETLVGQVTTSVTVFMWTTFATTLFMQLSSVFLILTFTMRLVRKKIFSFAPLALFLTFLSTVLNLIMLTTTFSINQLDSAAKVGGIQAVLALSIVACILYFTYQVIFSADRKKHLLAMKRAAIMGLCATVLGASVSTIGAMTVTVDTSLPTTKNERVITAGYGYSMLSGLLDYLN